MPAARSRLPANALTTLARELAQLAGLDGRYTGHSFRIGGATAMAANGVTLEQIMAIGGWRSGAVHKYIRDGE